MAYFSRFPTFRPRWHPSMPMPPPPRAEPEEENQVPFIPPDIYLDSSESSQEEEDEEEHFKAIQRTPTQPQFKTPPPQPRRENTLIPLKAYKFRASRNEWKHSPTSGMNLDPERELEIDRKKPRHSELRIITWNVDMATQDHEGRLEAALRHIEEDVLECKGGDEPREACCILLQEMRDTILPFLLKDEWVRRWFVVTPYTKDKWPEGARYGNVTLVSRSLNIAECHILHYAFSNMQRTAVCVKVKLTQPGTNEKLIISIVNTHLESLPMGTEARPQQLEMCARFLRLRGVQGGVIAGDMNSIGPKDGVIAKNLGLKDSWRRGDDDDTGKTWGYQGQNEGNFPCSRLDKLFYLGGRGYRVDEPKRIGVGLKVGEGKDALWVSDHYGLDTTLQLLKPRSNSS